MHLNDITTEYRRNKQTGWMTTPTELLPIMRPSKITLQLTHTHHTQAILSLSFRHGVLFACMCVGKKSKERTSSTSTKDTAKRWVVQRTRRNSSYTFICCAPASRIGEEGGGEGEMMKVKKTYTTIITDNTTHTHTYTVGALPEHRMASSNGALLPRHTKTWRRC